jgi:hypothetical protein
MPPRDVFRQFMYNLSCGKRSRTEADLFGRVLIFWKRDRLIGHLVDRPDDLEHLVGGDGSIAVNVIELEGP